MKCVARRDDFATRREHLAGLSDAELHERFWSLVDRLVAPLVAEAHTHTTPSIERSVLLRMGFASHEAKALVAGMAQRGLLGHGAGRLLLEQSRRRGASLRETGRELLEGRGWEELPG